MDLVDVMTQLLEGRSLEIHASVKLGPRDEPVVRTRGSARETGGDDE